MNLDSFPITYVHDFYTDENHKNYNIKIGVVLLKQVAPQCLKCKWGQVVAFPTLQAAVNLVDEGIRLMDIVDMIGSNHLDKNLRASYFRIDDKGFAHRWVHKTRIGPITTLVEQSTTPLTIVSTTDLISTSLDGSMHPIDARRLMREHMSKSLKSEI
jgi:hypothetical protein